MTEMPRWGQSTRRTGGVWHRIVGPLPGLRNTWRAGCNFVLVGARAVFRFTRDAPAGPLCQSCLVPKLGPTQRARARRAMMAQEKA